MLPSGLDEPELALHFTLLSTDDNVEVGILGGDIVVRGGGLARTVREARPRWLRRPDRPLAIGGNGMTAVVGAGAALLGALVGATVAMWVAAYTQRHQDRREKRQRVHASFRRVLLAAGTLAGMTRPWGGSAWSEDRMSEAEHRAFHEALGELVEELRQAAVDLTLEGIEGPVAAVNELVKRFDDFLWHQRRVSKPGVTEEVAKVPAEAAQAIAAIQQDLVVRLPAILDDILPVRRRRWIARLRKRMGLGRDRG